ncbi:MAG TPA: RNA polymerase sigma factor [Trebonia sp.]
MDDDELIAALADGDDMALRELFARHAPWLAARLRAALPPPDVEDVLQETFLAVWKGAKAYKPQGAAQAWLWVIARNQAAFLLRKRGPATTGLPDETTSRLLGERADGGGFALGGTDPAAAALARADLAAASSTLSAPEREVLRLVYVEDRPIAEVAKIIGIPEGTVKSRAYRARRLLRAALHGVPHDAGPRAAEGGAR